jgi:MoxR-like ATPase
MKLEPNELASIMGTSTMTTLSKDDTGGLLLYAPLMHSKITESMSSLNSVVFDKDSEIRLALTCLLAQGHLLIEDVPGVGKTTLVRALGKVCGLDVQRIQFTVDLLPADLLGASIYNQSTQNFTFRKGPLFSQMVIADELNRASPRTQSALLQAMEEQEVSIDSQTFSLPQPFFVVATQNPHQQVGTFPLPESQIDRFMMSLELNYPNSTVELAILTAGDPKDRIKNLKQILSTEDFKTAFIEISKVNVSEIVAKYVSLLLNKSRTTFSGLKSGSLPLSTRAGILLVRAAKAWAFIDGKKFVTPDDVQKVMSPVLGHRLGGSHGVRQGHQWAELLRRETEVPI